jgi:DNA gyrase subunit A
MGQCIRFPVTDIRVFAGRNSVGVRGIRLAEKDDLISMTILGHVDAEPWQRAAYIKRAMAERRLDDEDTDDISTDDGDEIVGEGELTQEFYDEMKAREQFVLTVSAKGYGKRSSSYEFRTSGRGGKGIRATDTGKTATIGKLVATFPVEDDNQIMLVSDGGQVIRVPVDGIRMAGRATKGVTIFSTAKNENVVSVDRISEPSDDGEDEIDGEVNTEEAAEGADTAVVEPTSDDGEKGA